MSVWKRAGKLTFLAFLVLFSTGAVEKQTGKPLSPFAVSARVLSVASHTVTSEIAVSISAGHVLYARAFSVTSENAEVVCETPLPVVRKPDPLDPDETVNVFTNSFVSSWKVKRSSTGDFTLAVSYQGCSDVVCFMPETVSFHYHAMSNLLSPTGKGGEEKISESKGDGTPWWTGRSLTVAGGYLGPVEFCAFLDRAEGKIDKLSFFSNPVDFLRKNGIWITLLLILLGGVLLNFTPCVLPMIPVNLAIIGAVVSGAGKGRSKSGKGVGLLLGGAYGAGMVLAYGGAGWVVVRSGAVFGSLQGSPGFNLTIAVLFAVFSLAMFDVFELDFTKWRKRKFGTATQNAGLGSRIFAATLAGAVSAVLAGACVAPVVLAVLLLAGALYGEGNHAAQFLPFVLGLGMALPWPFAGMGLSVLPKPGLWMVWVKRGFGVLLLLLTSYYGYLAMQGFRDGRSKLIEDKENEISIPAGERPLWEAALQRAGNKPVLVDFWATWCKNCTLMERRTFRDAKVLERLSGYQIIRVQAERPDDVRAMLDAFGVKGFPFFAVLRVD